MLPKIAGIIIIVTGILIGLVFVPVNNIFEISLSEKAPSPMMVYENSDDEILMGFKIIPVGCSMTKSSLTESHFQVTNTHKKDYGVTIGVSFTNNESILYEKEIDVIILAGKTIDQIHLSNDVYDNPICVVQIRDWQEI